MMPAQPCVFGGDLYNGTPVSSAPTSDQPQRLNESVLFSAPIRPNAPLNQQNSQIRIASFSYPPSVDFPLLLYCDSVSPSQVAVVAHFKIVCISDNGDQRTGVVVLIPFSSISR